MRFAYATHVPPYFSPRSRYDASPAIGHPRHARHGAAHRAPEPLLIVRTGELPYERCAAHRILLLLPAPGMWPPHAHPVAVVLVGMDGAQRTYKEASQLRSVSSVCQTGLRGEEVESAPRGSHARRAASFALVLISA